MCNHPEVKVWTDGNDPTAAVALCTFCEAEISEQWWAEGLRHDYALVPRQLGQMQLFRLPGVKPAGCASHRWRDGRCVMCGIDDEDRCSQRSMGERCVLMADHTGMHDIGAW